MRAMAIVLVCLACGCHGYRLQITTDQTEHSLHAKHKHVDGVLGSPLKIFLMGLLASSNAAKSPSLAEPQSKIHQRPVNDHSNQTWHHLQQSDIQKLSVLRGKPSYLTVARNWVARRSGAFIPPIKGLSSLTSLTKDIYDLQSGDILLLSKQDIVPESLQTQNDVLEAVQQAGISVVPHKLIQTIHPVTGKIAKGMIQPRIRGTFVNFQNEEDAPEKLIASLNSISTVTIFKDKWPLALPDSAFTKAVHNLKDDLMRIKSARNSGFRIEGLQGIIQPDGHFIVMDPLGITLPSGEYIGEYGTADMSSLNMSEFSRHAQDNHPWRVRFDDRSRKAKVHDGMKRVKRTLFMLDNLLFQLRR